MNRFVASFVLSLILMSCSDSQIEKEFCEVKAFDNVFNVGYFVHFTRCGEVWSHDRGLLDESGGLIRDYSWYSFAQQLIIERDGITFNRSSFRFAAFSIHNIECDIWWTDIERECAYSAEMWNGISFIASEQSISVFTYDLEFYILSEDIIDEHNPFSKYSYFNLSEKRYPFWPDFNKIAPQFQFDNTGDKNPYIYAGVFHKNEFRLFLVLLAPDNKHYCITHLNMKRMLLDMRLWPSRVYDDDTELYDWAPAFCFIGHVVGLFLRNERPYLAGQVRASDEYYFEDEVYSLDAGDGSPVEVNQVFVKDSEFPLNLRTFFGCPPILVAPKVPGLVDRKKRSIEESEPILAFNWKDITAEVKEDWIQLSVLSFVALFLIFFIFKLFKK